MTLKLWGQLTLLSLTITTMSCDPIYTSEIKNETNDKLTIEVKFDDKRLNEIWGERPFIPYLKRHGLKDGVNILEFDTINFRTTYSVDPKNIFWVEHGMSRPDYEIYKTIKIISPSDTLLIEGQEELKKTFRQVAKRTWELEIKQ